MKFLSNLFARPLYKKATFHRLGGEYEVAVPYTNGTWKNYTGIYSTWYDSRGKRVNNKISKKLRVAAGGGTYLRCH